MSKGGWKYAQPPEGTPEALKPWMTLRHVADPELMVLQRAGVARRDPDKSEGWLARQWQCFVVSSMLCYHRTPAEATAVIKRAFADQEVREALLE